MDISLVGWHAQYLLISGSAIPPFSLGRTGWLKLVLGCLLYHKKIVQCFLYVEKKAGGNQMGSACIMYSNLGYTFIHLQEVSSDNHEKEVCPSFEDHVLCFARQVDCFQNIAWRVVQGVACQDTSSRYTGYLIGSMRLPQAERHCVFECV